MSKKSSLSIASTGGGLTARGPARPLYAMQIISKLSPDDWLSREAHPDEQDEHPEVHPEEHEVEDLQDLEVHEDLQHDLQSPLGPVGPGAPLKVHLYFHPL